MGENYNPEVGYVPRMNYFQANPELGKIFYPKNKLTNLFYTQVRLNSLNYWNNSGGRTDNTTYLAFEGYMKDRSSFSAWPMIMSNYYMILMQQGWEILL